ncbi:hypothetical protein FB451DRAFT_1195364 [Mycena latifolia]|nr:hypothetical protein FB451DRAFT_1195364 [Mycena latifolia]
MPIREDSNIGTIGERHWRQSTPARAGAEAAAKADGEERSVASSVGLCKEESERRKRGGSVEARGAKIKNETIKVKQDARVVRHDRALSEGVCVGGRRGVVGIQKSKSEKETHIIPIALEDLPEDSDKRLVRRDSASACDHQGLLALLDEGDEQHGFEGVNRNQAGRVQREEDERDEDPIGDPELPGIQIQLKIRFYDMHLSECRGVKDGQQCVEGELEGRRRGQEAGEGGGGGGAGVRAGAGEEVRDGGAGVGIGGRRLRRCRHEAQRREDTVHVRSPGGGLQDSAGLCTCCTHVSRADFGIPDRPLDIIIQEVQEGLIRNIRAKQVRTTTQFNQISTKFKVTKMSTIFPS